MIKRESLESSSDSGYNQATRLDITANSNVSTMQMTSETAIYTDSCQLHKLVWWACHKKQQSLQQMWSKSTICNQSTQDAAAPSPWP